MSNVNLKLILILNFLIRPIVTLLPIPNVLSLVLIPFFALYGIVFLKKNNYIFFFLLILFLINLISSLINQISPINALLNFCIITAPFFLHLIIINKQLNKKYLDSIESLFIFLLLINFLISIFQLFIYGEQDKVQGFFVGQGMGHHINGAINFFFSIYLFWKYLRFNKLYIYILIFLFLFVTYISDTKTVVFALLCSLFFLVIKGLLKVIFGIRKSEHFKNFFLILIISIFCITLSYLVFTFIINLSHLNLEYFKTGFMNKYSLYIILSDDLLHFLIGHGPGMTTSKLSFMANFFERYSFLENFYYDFSKLADYIFFNYQYSNYLTNPTTGSSLFQVNFTFGGVFGDLGVFGFLIYLALFHNTFKSNNNFIADIFYIQFFLLGFFFTWLEEIFFTVPIIFIYLLVTQNLKR